MRNEWKYDFRTLRTKYINIKYINEKFKLIIILKKKDRVFILFYVYVSNFNFSKFMNERGVVKYQCAVIRFGWRDPTAE